MVQRGKAPGSRLRLDGTAAGPALVHPARQGRPGLLPSSLSTALDFHRYISCPPCSWVRIQQTQTDKGPSQGRDLSRLDHAANALLLQGGQEAQEGRTRISAPYPPSWSSSQAVLRRDSLSTANHLMEQNREFFPVPFRSTAWLLAAAIA
jgi:hypothetical protein